MKSIVKKLILVCISLILCGCQVDKQRSILSSNDIQRSSEPESQKVHIQVNNLIDEQDSKLSNEDFKVYKGDIYIELGMEYKNLEMDEQELSADNMLLTSKTVGNYYYKYFLHEYKTISIITSNQGYEEKGDDFDTYYIVSIVLKDTSYSTNRGIKVGNAKKEVISQYGDKDLIASDKYVKYILDDKVISFHFNKDNIVEQITLSTSTNENDSLISQAEDTVSIYNAIIYTNKKAGFSVALPKSWEGKYKIDEWEEGVRFIHLINQQEGDLLFSVSIFGTVQEWNETGDYPYNYVGEQGGLVYVTRYPSESSYDYDTEKGKSYIQDYQQIWEELGDIEDRVQFTTMISQKYYDSP